MSVIEKNSEILFLYDAKMCNPNGDPDDENRPRMDYDRERCLVSDVRLKRYLRDYLEEKGHTIYVTKSAGIVQAPLFYLIALLSLDGQMTASK